MILNKKVLKVMENSKPRNVERFDKMALKMLQDSVKDEPLALIEFTTLANLYNIPYTVVVDTGVKTYVFDESGILWNDLWELYYKLTCRHLRTTDLTFTELQNYFKKIGATVTFN
jgi:hypothetical protein